MSRQHISVKKLMDIFGREFVASDEFLKPDAEKLILSTPLEQLFSETSNQPGFLSRQQETEMFRRYNFLKFLACRQRGQIQRIRPSSTHIREVEAFITQAESVKKIIIRSRSIYHSGRIGQKNHY
jgi:hypothetical protein